jgi:hypothetical protein
MFEKILHLLLIVYVCSFAFYTLLNSSGIAPLTLFVAFAMMIFILVSAKHLYVPNFNINDVLILFILIITLLSFLFSSESSLNANYLLAYLYVVLAYYLTQRVIIYNLNIRSLGFVPFKGLYFLFVIIVITGILDYFLLINGINIRELLDLTKANKLAGTGIFVRPTGFFVEPTDYALFLSATFPFAFIYLNVFQKYDKKNKFIIFYYFLLFFALLVLTRSAAAVAGIIIGLALIALDFILRYNYKLRFLVKLCNIYSIIFIFFVSLLFIFDLPFLSDVIEIIFSKIFLSDEMASANNRYFAWSRAINLFLDSPNVIIGYGTGYLSGTKVSAISWHLSLLVDNGIISIALLSIIHVYTYYLIFRLDPLFRYALYVSYTVLSVGLFTNTGFYFPLFWFITALIPSVHNSRYRAPFTTPKELTTF